MTGAQQPREEVVLKGVGVSPGIAFGSVLLLNTDEGERYVERPIEADEIPREVTRFEDALLATRKQLHAIQETVGRAIGRDHALIFDAHLLVVDDPSFIEKVLRGLEEQLVNVEPVVMAVAEEYAAALARIDDDYLKERAADVLDVSRRILRNLAGSGPIALTDLDEPRLVVANDLAPSDTATMDPELVLGFATDLGSPTSHTAIMARALEIPAVVGLHDISTRVSDGDRLLLDGTKGLLVIRPTEERLEEYGKVASAQQAARSKLSALRDLDAETLDGYRVIVSANIESVHDVPSVLRHGGRGVGLFRTEYLYLTAADHLPGEEEQREVYREVIERLAPDPVIIRTLDLGGDKFLSTMKATRELNPFLGWRGIRFCLARRDIFKTQLRALLRAGAGTQLKLMYPMISNVDEVLAANEVLHETMEELRLEEIPYCLNPEVGIMIEVPSAALTASVLAPRVDFFSLGTNDLVQYTLAVDRVNERIAYLYDPTHPAIVKLIAETVQAGRNFGIPTGACGEMAGNPMLVPLLVGLGVRELSVSPNMIPLVKAVVRSLRFVEAEDLAREALNGKRGADILERSRELARSAAPEVVALMD